MTYLFFTGAGISANAGIATYRDGGSSWTDSDLEQKSHSSRYGNHLTELWDKHWGPMQSAMRTALPTHTHKAIAEFQKTHQAIIATQNIDDLHERAGSENVAHLHGDIKARCIRCKSKDVRPWSGTGAPSCYACGSIKTRPDVVLFGELLNRKLMRGLETYVRNEVTHVVSIGSSLNVFPATGLVFDAITQGKHVTIINKQPTSLDKFATKVYNEDVDSVIDEVLENIKEQ